MKLKFLFILISILFARSAFSQIKVTASNEALSTVLISIRDDYNVDFSFNATELSTYKVTVHRTFSSVESALNNLLSGLPYLYMKRHGVYVIYPKTDFDEDLVVKKRVKVYTISGRILELGTKEILPYSHISINSNGLISDANGNFNFTTTDSVFRIKVSHLGYLIKDTVIHSVPRNLNLQLKPADRLLAEVKVTDKLIENFYNQGNQAGTVKLNHRVTKYLPGNSDNSVFNLLRLQSGVLAAGEQSRDLIIWGAYQGQSRVLFDGILVFGLKNFNDNISAINPLITQSIELRKAGYDASKGGCVGGIVEILGKNGNSDDLKLSLSANNLTMSTLLEVPVFKKSALQVAYRQTYYNLYNNGYDLLNSDVAKAAAEENGIEIMPDYKFRDVNLKYHYKSDKELFYLSALNSNDRFEYSISEEKQYRSIETSNNEENKQYGTSLYYERKINNGLLFKTLFSHSALNSGLNDKKHIMSLITGKEIINLIQTAENTVSETHINTGLTFNKLSNSLSAVFHFIGNTSGYTDVISNEEVINSEEKGNYFVLELNDKKSFKNATATLGIRLNLLPFLNEMSFEPRLGFSLDLSNEFKLNGSWGVYYQYLQQASIIDPIGNYRYLWTLADNKSVKPLIAEHLVGGASYVRDNFSLSANLYYRKTRDISRYMRNLKLGIDTTLLGNARSYGADLVMKYNYKGHSLWFAYTLCKTLEHFDYMPSGEYLYAAHDQRHEIKLVGLLDFDPFYFSTNYVYGSGFLQYPNLQNTIHNRIPYNRLDASFTYRFFKNKNRGELGISVLNVLNTDNLKISTFEKIPLSQLNSTNIYFDAMPFTPTVFFVLRF